MGTHCTLLQDVWAATGDQTRREHSHPLTQAASWAGDRQGSDNEGKKPKGQVRGPVRKGLAQREVGEGNDY